METTVTQVVDGGLRVAPPVGVSAASFLGLGMEDWMYVATITYTVLQGSFLIYKWRLAHRKHKERKNGRTDN